MRYQRKYAQRKTQNAQRTRLVLTRNPLLHSFTPPLPLTQLCNRWRTRMGARNRSTSWWPQVSRSFWVLGTRCLLTPLTPGHPSHPSHRWRTPLIHFHCFYCFHCFYASHPFHTTSTTFCNLLLSLLSSPYVSLRIARSETSNRTRYAGKRCSRFQGAWNGPAWGLPFLIIRTIFILIVPFSLFFSLIFVSPSLSYYLPLQL